MKRYEYAGAPLTRESAEVLLDSFGVHHSAYSLTGAQVFDGFVLRQTPNGWIVFYTERGRDDEPTVHPTEAEGCRALVERVLNGGGGRGWRRGSIRDR